MMFHISKCHGTHLFLFKEKESEKSLMLLVLIRLSVLISDFFVGICELSMVLKQ